MPFFTSELHSLVLTTQKVAFLGVVSRWSYELGFGLGFCLGWELRTSIRTFQFSDSFFPPVFFFKCFFSFSVLIFVNIFLSLFVFLVLLIFFAVKCVVDRYKWHRPFQMATTVLRNANDRFKWQRPFTKGKFATAKHFHDITKYYKRNEWKPKIWSVIRVKIETQILLWFLEAF